ncbi:MAG: AAA family ATPase [Planctomycetes bacterium]|nr:AAA family ATPase [Planctomycetota bacterium]
MTNYEFTGLEKDIKEFRDTFQKVQNEIRKVIIGHHDVVRYTLMAIIAGGHVLLEGVPGIGKTLLVKSFANCFDLDFSRIQFTPDLMPADVVGTNIIVEEPGKKLHFEFQRGPVFSDVLLADEINRATPKTQSALLEAMQERTVTSGGATHALSEHFFVLATQNPIEMEGTFPLPEAQLDRFFFKLSMSPASEEELCELLSEPGPKDPSAISKVADRDMLSRMRALVHRVPVASHLISFAARLVQATNPGTKFASERVNSWVLLGASPRGGQALITAAKVSALARGELCVSEKDIIDVLLPSLRHRIIFAFEGEAQGAKADDVLLELLQVVKAPSA